MSLQWFISERVEANVGRTTGSRHPSCPGNVTGQVPPPPPLLVFHQTKPDTRKSVNLPNCTGLCSFRSVSPDSVQLLHRNCRTVGHTAFWGRPTCVHTRMVKQKQDSAADATRQLGFPVTIFRAPSCPDARSATPLWKGCVRFQVFI